MREHLELVREAILKVMTQPATADRPSSPADAAKPELRYGT
jgi:hypothetical protein